LTDPAIGILTDVFPESGHRFLNWRRNKDDAFFFLVMAATGKYWAITSCSFLAASKMSHEMC
jgi:hypothetical protein